MLTTFAAGKGCGAGIVHTLGFDEMGLGIALDIPTLFTVGSPGSGFPGKSMVYKMCKAFS